MHAVVTFLQDALRVRPEEARRTLLAFTYLFSTIGAFITARIAKSSLFLEIPNYKQQLPLTYIGIAITVSLVMTGYAKFERKLRRDRTNLISLALIIGITVIFRGLLDLDRSAGLFLENPKHEIYWAFLLWAEIMGAVVIVQFWSMIPEIFNSRQAKRLFAIIGGGGVLANIAFGKLNRWLVSLIGTENLLFVIALCLGVAMLMIYLLGSDARGELEAAHERAPAKGPGKKRTDGFGQVFATRHVQLIGLVIVLTYLVSAMVDYQFNVIVGDSIPGKDARSGYFSDFFAYTGIIAAVIQFTMTSRILEKFGVLFALLMLPVFMLAGSGTVALALLSPLWAATFTKGSENVLRYTVNDSTLQLLYLPVPSHIRGQAKAIIDGIMKPMSMGAAGLITAVLVGTFTQLTGIDLGFRLSVYELSYIVGGALLMWATSIVWLRREYLKSLVNTLQRRRLNFEEVGFQISDEGTISTLEHALASENVGHVLHALELLPHMGRKARDPLQKSVVRLVFHEADEVRVAALNYLSHNHEEGLGEITKLLDDASRDVRAAAILAYCSAQREKAIERIHPMLEDPDRKVQAAAVAGLIRHGGLDGVLACADLLKYWLNSRDLLDRRHSAWVLGEVGVENFYQPLIPLLADDDESVRLEAVIAAGRLANPELVEPLIQQLERPRLSAAAVSALATFGDQVEEIIGEVVSDPEASVETRVQACKVLARLGDSRAAQLLLERVTDPDTHIRIGAAQALVSVAHRLPGLRIDPDTITRAIYDEARRWFNLGALRLDLKLGENSDLLNDALLHRAELARNQILALLSLKYPRETIDLVARNLRSKQAATIANAVEVLDNILEREKSVVIPIFDDSPLEKRIQAAAEELQIKRRKRKSRLEELLKGSDSWLQICAAMEIGEEGMSALESEVAALLESPHPVCRETAMVVLKKLRGKKKLPKDAEKLIDDPEPHVRAFARFTLGIDDPEPEPA